MEIQKASTQQQKANVSQNLGGVINDSRSVTNSIRQEQQVWQRAANLSANVLNKKLAAKGTEDALLDAAADGKLQAEYEVAAINLENDPENAAKKKAYDTSKAALKGKVLDTSPNGITAYGKSYQDKAQKITLNRYTIDLDKVATATYLDNKENPAEYANQMHAYAQQIKENLPETLHAAYDAKVALANNAAQKSINKNIIKIQDEELAATIIEKLDLTDMNMQNAAANNDQAVFISSKASYAKQLQGMVNDRLITQAKADDQYRVAVSNATSTSILNNFNTLLREDPDAAIEFYEKFSVSTSDKMYGLSARQLENKKKIPKDNQANMMDIEYDPDERDTMAAQMNSAIKLYDKALKATNKQSKTDNNKFAKAQIATLKAGKQVENPLTGLVRGENIGAYEYDKLQFYKINQANIINFNNLNTIQEQETTIDKMKSKPSANSEEKELIKEYESIVEDRKKLNETNPGQVAQTLAYGAETFGPKLDIADPTAFIDFMLPYMNYTHNTNNTKKHLMTTQQASQVKAYWDQLGEMDQIAYVNNIGSTKGAEEFFDQLGDSGSKMKVVYNLTAGKGLGSIQTTQTILNGQKQIDQKLRTYNKKDTEDFIIANLNGRTAGMDIGVKKAYEEAIIAHAIGNNPEAIDIDESMIKTSIDAVFGAVNDDFFGGNDMVIYDKTSDQVETYMETVTQDQVEATIPPDAKFYSSDPKTPMTSKTLSEEIKMGKIELIGTGVNGEYILKRSGQAIMVDTPSDIVKEDGSVWMQKQVYKFKLWSN